MNRREVICLVFVLVAIWAVKWLTAPAPVAATQPGASSQGNVSVLAFGASWCGPCRRDKPKREELARHVAVTYIDVDDDPNGEAQRFGVDALPTYIVFEQKPEGYVEQLRTTNIDEVFSFLSL